MKAGMDPDMPAAVLSKGTTAGQQRVVATVATLKTASFQKFLLCTLTDHRDFCISKRTQVDLLFSICLKKTSTPAGLVNTSQS